MPEKKTSLVLPVASLFLALHAGCEGGGNNSSPPATVVTDRAAPGVEKTIEQRALKRPVDSETLPYADVDENLVYGYFAFPSDMIEPLPAVILIHDWWGINDDTRASADQLASEGYMVLAIDLYSGETFESADKARKQTIAILENQGAVEDNIGQALEFLEAADAPAIGAAGWGFGGGWSLSTAILFAEQIDAAVVTYGPVISDPERLQPINAPILALFGAKDRGIPVAATEQFADSMQRLRKDVDVHVYPGVGHGFADPMRNSFDRKTADDAWSRMLEFFARHLTTPE